MIEWRALVTHSFIGERFQESNDRYFVQRPEACPFKIGVHVRGREITAVAIEIHHLAKRSLAAVHKERSGEFYVAQAGRLHCSVDGDRRAGWDRSSADLSHGRELSDRERRQSRRIRS